MAKKPTYFELQQKVEELKKKLAVHERTEKEQQRTSNMMQALLDNSPRFYLH